MWARVVRFKEPKERLDEDIRESKEIIREAIKRIPGSRGVYYLVDRETGDVLNVTLWEDEQAMWATEEETARMREESAAKLGATILGIERYEVALEPSDVMPAA